MNLEEQKFEDREGSDFEKGEGSNLQKIVDRKELSQKKKLGIKPTDTDIDISSAVSRDVLGKVLSEEMPKQEIVGQDNSVEEEDDEEDKEKEDKTFDHKEEMRIKMMQLLNPRIVKSGELKNYMSREDIKEEIFATLNQLASHKLDLMKTALAIDEGKQENKEKLRNAEQLDEANRNPNIMRQGRTKIVKARVRGGKVQRRKRLSAVKGYTIRGGKLKRMTMQERLRRKRSQRRAKVKRRAKMARALMKRKRSMRRRASLGLKE